MSSAISSKAMGQIEKMERIYERSPVYSRSLYSISKDDPSLLNLKRISNGYISSQDSFVVTLIDMDENNSFVNQKDVVVITTLNDSLVPIIPNCNSNAAYYKSGLVFDYYGTRYQLIDATSDGQIINLKQIDSDLNSDLHIIVTNQISNELIVNDIKTFNSFNLLKILKMQNTKYAILYFWSLNCPPCFENIPKLQKLNSSGITILNIFYINDNEIPLAEKQISNFNIPGINFRASPQLIKYFSQNGFPYSVLVDVESNKILSSDFLLEKHEKHIK